MKLAQDNFIVVEHSVRSDANQPFLHKELLLSG